MAAITAGTGTINVRDVIARIEAIEAETAREEWDDEEQRLLGLMSDLKGNGGDDEWRGGQYPSFLIEDSGFEDFAMEEAENIHGAAIWKNAWPFNCIDWARAAVELQQHYSSVEYGGYTYWYR